MANTNADRNIVVDSTLIYKVYSLYSNKYYLFMEITEGKLHFQNSGAQNGIQENLGRYLGALGSMLKSRMFTHTPFFLAHAMTFGCNSRCKSCTYWKNTPRMKEDLSTEGVFQLLDDAYDAGMRGYYMFGGEPLIRRDIGKITDYAKEKGFITVMNTNGSFLEKKAEELKNLDFAFVSLDYYNVYDDIIRGRPGTFNEVMKGIAKLKEIGMTKVSLVTTISTLNWGSMRKMSELSKSLGVGISFNSVEQSLDFGQTDENSTPNFQIGLSNEKLHEFYQTLLDLKREGYPLMETERVLEDYVVGKPWTCHFPKMFVYVTPDKQVYNCDYTYAYDLKKGSFKDYFHSNAFADYARKSESCNRCVRTCVRGYSYTYSFFPRQIMGLAGEARNLFNKEPENPSHTVLDGKATTGSTGPNA
ncbi:pyrroloquinoline quinone biosynthesis protein PqqE [Thermoplasmatales archaeon]|nr:pyrroloquinoline quinone biosynthesis protein PqqE [Thermoplasmatales archaeon]